MIKLFVLLFSIEVMALTPSEEMRARLETIEDKYSALERCGLLFDAKERGWDKILDKVAEKLETNKESCLLEQQQKTNKEKRLKQAQRTINQEDCNLLGTDFLKSVCILLKDKN